MVALPVSSDGGIALKAAFRGTEARKCSGGKYSQPIVPVEVLLKRCFEK